MTAARGPAAPAAAPKPTLLALRAIGLGDLLTAVPALRALAEAFPRHRRLLAAPGHLRPLVDLIGTDGQGEQAPGFELVDAGELEPLAHRLQPPEVAVNLHGRGPQSHRILLALRPERLICFAIPGLADGPSWREDEHEVERWCRLLRESGIPASRHRLEIDRPKPDVPVAARGATVVHPGAASAARRWPADRWAEVVRSEAMRGRPVVVTGGRDEADLARSVAERAGLDDGVVIAGRTDLRQLAAVVAGAGRVLCGDTGISHLATALGTPSVTLFGPVSPQHWGPPADRPQHRVLWAGRPGDPHADTPGRGLLEIEVDQVLAEVDRLPAERSAVAAR